MSNNAEIVSPKTDVLRVRHAANWCIGVETANTLVTVGGGSFRSFSRKSASADVDWFRVRRRSG